MPKARVSSASRATHKGGARSHRKLKCHRFLGIDLTGGKNDKTSLAVLEYYPSQSKLFLTHVYDHIQSEGEVSGDQVLYGIVKEHEQGLEHLCIDAPLQLPKCIRCKLKCPGFEKCKEPEILWMWKEHRKAKKKKSRVRLFTPYTQRASEMFISHELSEEMHPMETLGANIAPLTARAHFLIRRLSQTISLLEIYPRLSVLRIGHSLRVNRSHLLHYKNPVTGAESRDAILSALLRRDSIFIYQQDFAKLVENPHSFDAFICALTGYLKFKGQCDERPKDFPKSEGWIEIPASDSKI
ncbi:MAG: DUF429 domain-containing protein [Oligoflexia bacterium]|nr:DUF429 domain-containing protein [Oligoflexia bacterium]